MNKDREKEFIRDLAALLNGYNAEFESNTPDWILAEFLFFSLKTWNKCAPVRDKWYDNDLTLKQFTDRRFLCPSPKPSRNAEPKPISPVIKLKSVPGKLRAKVLKQEKTVTSRKRRSRKTERT